MKSSGLSASISKVTNFFPTCSLVPQVTQRSKCGVVRQRVTSITEQPHSVTGFIMTDLMDTRVPAAAFIGQLHRTISPHP